MQRAASLQLSAKPRRIGMVVETSHYLLYRTFAAFFSSSSFYT
jgi:hypothetical protein